jgi:hypothetical protein
MMRMTPERRVDGESSLNERIRYEPPKAMKATIENGKRPFPHVFPTKLTTSMSILKSEGPLIASFGGDDGVVILSIERGTIDKLNI